MNKKILVVEDEVTQRKALCEKLTQEGFDFIEAVNGEEGLKVLNDSVPDLILLDIIMPKMDGMAFLNEFKKNPNWKNIPVIILSNLTDFERIDETLKNGVYDY
ncbi:MAG: response regulator, partial [Patescibacteria group bacterium]|nr:response regulator [Patescibacteria group bacterium]